MSTNLGPISIDNLVPAAIEYERVRTLNDSVRHTHDLTRQEIELIVHVFRIVATEINTLNAGDLIPAELTSKIKSALAPLAHYCDVAER